MPETDIWGWLGFDKVAHLFVFAVLVFLMIVGFSKQYTYLFLRDRAVVASLVICLVYGLLIECIQALVPARSLEYSDLLADMFGCGIGYAIFFGVYKS